jgi:hypothetical protein
MISSRWVYRGTHQCNQLHGGGLVYAIELPAGFDWRERFLRRDISISMNNTAMKARGARQARAATNIASKNKIL